MNPIDVFSDIEQGGHCRDAVQCASLLKRLLYLDLNLNAQTKKTTSACTQSGCTEDNQRSLMDTLGLDCDKRLEKLPITCSNKFSLSSVEVRTRVSQFQDIRKMHRKCVQLLCKIRRVRFWNENFANHYLSYFERFIRFQMEWSNTYLFKEFLQTLVCNPDFERHVFRCTDIECVEYVLKRARKIRFQLWVHLPSHVLGNRKYMIRPDFDSIRVLLKYGVSMNHVIFFDTEGMNWAPMNMGSYIINWRVSSERKMRINQLLIFAKIALSHKTAAKEAARCFRLMWSAFPDPYITRAELLCYMNKSCRWVEAAALEQNFSTKSQVCKFYEQQVGAKVNVIQPRSLKHLSRCFIRQHLWENFQLPEGINKLDVPADLHGYLSLEF